MGRRMEIGRRGRDGGERESGGREERNNKTIINSLGEGSEKEKVEGGRVDSFGGGGGRRWREEGWR